jgi:hypothetical protein
MIRLSDVSFQREARWLLFLTVVIPAVGFVIAVVIPAVARWLGWR